MACPYSACEKLTEASQALSMGQGLTGTAKAPPCPELCGVAITLRSICVCPAPIPHSS
jgi:hypothetical protein